MNRNYYELYMGGRIKYTVNYHDGQQMHRDGSPFYGCAIFKNRKDKNAFVARLKSEGYVPR